MDISTNKFVVDLLGGNSAVSNVRRTARAKVSRTEFKALRVQTYVDDILDDLEDERLQEIDLRPRIYGSSSEEIISCR